jgi:hypothetical protein
VGVLADMGRRGAGSWAGSQLLRHGSSPFWVLLLNVLSLQKSHSARP